MIVHQAYRFALDPTPAQARALSAHCGAARFAFNWGLALVKAVMNQREAEASHGTLRWSMPTLRKAWNQTEDEVAPWWARPGPQVRFPRFRSKRRTRRSCRFTTAPIRVEPDRRHITLPRLGRIRTHGATRKLARRIDAGTARILAATVRLEGGRWFCSFTCEVQRTDLPPAKPAVLSQPISGVTDLAGFVANPHHLGRALAALRRRSRTVSRRQGQDRRGGPRPSKRWERANQRRNRIRHRVANLRRDGLHKLTTALANEFGTIVVEDLHVAGMLRNRRSARSIADTGFGEVRRQLAYKTRWRGSRLVVADRWFPSSKTCSDCGVVKAKLPLHIRVFRCESCGLETDRDLNAARDLAALVVRSTTGTGDLEPRGSNGRGADRKTHLTWAGGDETSTPHWTNGPSRDRPVQRNSVMPRCCDPDMVCR